MSAAPAAYPLPQPRDQSPVGGSAATATTAATSQPILTQLETQLLPTVARIEQLATRAFASQEQSAVVPYPVAEAQSDATELLALLATLTPLLHTTALAHVTPAMSAACPTAEHLNTALREAAATKESVLLHTFPKAQQLALERLTQHNKQRNIT